LWQGITHRPRMMKTLPLSQSPSISYEVTHNLLSQFLWVHNLHDDSIKCL
jgi:hypothetical protein